MSFPPTLLAARAARLYVAESCGAAGVPADVVDAGLLLTSEVVTNAVLHGRTSVALAVEVRDDVLRIEVTDESASLPVDVDADEGATSGRGVRIVEQLAHRWGVTPRSLGKTVWFELRVPLTG